MELLGEDLWEVCRYSKLSQKDVFLVAIKCFNILEKIHKKGILHCDIKLENIMTGKLDENNISSWILAWQRSTWTRMVSTRIW